jgi:cysteine desulfurase / selenocysteine lyase
MSDRHAAAPFEQGFFDLDQDVVWVAHCAVGPLPRAAAAAAAAMLAGRTRPWAADEGTWLELPARVRVAAARLVGGAADDISLVGSTSAGLAAIAQTIDWREGDEVLAPLGEFPSNIWPWKALAGRGVSFREVPLWAGHEAGASAWSSTPPPAACNPEARLLEALGPRTRVLTVSWVRFQDGLALDLGRLAEGCAARRVPLVVDGIQGAGTLPLQLDGVGAFVTGTHKGLLGPGGCGLLWTNAALRQQLAPLGSWLSVEEGSSFARPSTDHQRAWLQDGRKLELSGQNNAADLAGLEASLALIAATRPERLQAHIAALQEELLAALGGTLWGAEAQRLAALARRRRPSSIVALHHGGRGAAFLRDLCALGERQGIYSTVREGYLRLALHGWHTSADVERLARWLASAPGA